MANKFDIAKRYLKDKLGLILLFLLFAVIIFIVSVVYHLPLEIVFYALFICASIGLVFIIYDLYKYSLKHKRLISAKISISVYRDKLPIADTLIEEDYHSLMQALYNENHKLIRELDQGEKDLIEYYTLWTHQIKTPLAAIDLLLQLDEEDIKEDLELQIIEVEKYIDMALQYLRIDNMSSDLQLEKYSIQDIVKKAVKSFSKIFIYKDISLDIGDKDLNVITDKKWFLFAVRQILSNALKYTDIGKISIYVEDNNLFVKDTGIGIRKEDIPRIFERGFTGYAGRISEKSTGLGLYLSKRVLDNLGHKIEVYSKQNIGTTVKIDLSRPKLELE